MRWIISLGKKLIANFRNARVCCAPSQKCTIDDIHVSRELAGRGALTFNCLLLNLRLYHFCGNYQHNLQQKFYQRYIQNTGEFDQKMPQSHTMYRPTHGAVRKSQRTITATWHPEYRTTKIKTKQTLFSGLSILLQCFISLQNATSCDKKYSLFFEKRFIYVRRKGRGFEPHRRHCVVVLEQDTFILA